MPARSKIDTGLSEDVRRELDQRLIKGGFSGYRDLVAWLGDQGVEISLGSVMRHGRKLQREIAQIKAATDAARALVEASPDDGTAMAEASLRLVQRRMFDLICNCEDGDLAGMARAASALAKASNATVSLSKERRTVLAEAGARVTEAGKRAGLSPEVIAAIRTEVEGDTK